MKVADLYRSPNALAPCYRRFRVEDRLLLTGHSHQAWPDVGFDAHQQAWHDAAEHVDDKWDLAFERADRVRAGFARLLDDSEGDIALGANTHELVVRLLSALPLGERPRIVTTDGEFHTLRRQLDRHAEEGLEIVRVTAEPLDTVAARLADAIDGRTALAHAISDGEDFELLAAVEPGAAAELIAAPPFATPLADIGEIVEGNSAELLMPDGRIVPLPPLGYEHQLD